VRSRLSHPRAAFSKIELIVILAVVAVIAVLAWPTIHNALIKRDLTRTMTNARELYLVAFRMATDGAAKFDANRAWPGDTSTTLAEYCNKFVQNGYLKPADVERLLSAPEATCTASMSGPPATLQLSGKSALKLYKVKTSDPSNTIFAASTNYIYDTPLDPKTDPFGDAGFVVVRKSGDAGVYKKGQATPEGFEKNVARFQTEIGALPGAEMGVVAPGDAGTALTIPK
jgi:type II secretory pathway pseudopilin PulG